ncbi:MAG: N-acetyltransferase, partial [Candidatus Bathyarchaeia archaeon]
MVTIIPVKDKKAIEQFIKLPWSIYKNDPYWVPPLISDEKKMFNKDYHPFYKHADVELFLALDENDKPVGRIAAIVNHNHIKTHKEPVGFFGFFESINSPKVSNALLSHAGEFLKKHKMEKMRGPASFSSNEQWGLLTEGFDSSPVIMMPYNYPYYIELLTKQGLIKSKDLYAYYLATSAVTISDKMLRVAERIRSRENVRIRNLDISKFDAELKIIKEVYNKAWQYNWGAIPMTDEEMEHMAKDLKPIVDSELLFIATVDGKPAGFSLALPDYFQALKKINGRLFPFGLLKLLWYTKVRKVDMVRLITMGVIPEYQKRGIDIVFYIETVKQCLAKGFKGGELSWILEDNDLMNRA